MLLDSEEKDILESFNRGEWVSNKEDLEIYRKVVKEGSGELTPKILYEAKDSNS